METKTKPAPTTHHFEKTVEMNAVEFLRMILGDEDLDQATENVIDRFQEECSRNVKFDVVVNEEDFIVSSRED